MLRRLAIVLLALGAALVAFSVAWMVAVSPSYRLLRPDYHRTETLMGTFSDWDSASGTFAEWPVTVRREWTAVGVAGGALQIEEKVTPTVADGSARFYFPNSSARLLVDRKTAAYQVRAEWDREGLFSPPPGLKAGDSFLLWVQPVVWAAPLTYQGQGSIDGLRVLNFSVDVQDLPLPRETEGITQHSAAVAVELQVEPRTGYVVSRTERIVLKVMDGKFPARAQSITDLRFSPDEVARQARLARSGRLRVALLGTFMPWAVLGLGALLSVEGLFLLLVASWRRRASRSTSETGSRT